MLKQLLMMAEGDCVRRCVPLIPMIALGNNNFRNVFIPLPRSRVTELLIAVLLLILIVVIQLVELSFQPLFNFSVTDGSLILLLLSAHPMHV